MASSSTKIIVGLVLGGVGFLLHVVGMATDDWSTITASIGPLSVSSSFGPFSDNFGSSTSSELDAVRAMTVIGALLSGVALVLGVVGLLNKEKLPWSLKASGGLSIAAFFFIIIGAIIWVATGLYPSDYNLGYSFALSIAGGVLVLVAGIAIVVGEKNE